MATKKTTTAATKKKADKPVADAATEDKKKKSAVSAVPATKAKKTSVATAKPKKKAKETAADEEDDRPALRPYVTPPKPIVTPPPAVVVAPPAPAPAPAPAAPVAAAKPAPAEPAAAAPVETKPAAPEVKPVEPKKPTPAVPAPKAPAPSIFKPQTTKFAPQPAKRPVTSPKPYPSVPRPSAGPSRIDPKPLQAAAQPEGRKKIQFNEMMTVKDIAELMSVKIPEVMKKLLMLGKPVTINQRIDHDSAVLLADSFGFDVELKSIYAEEKAVTPDNPADLKPRAPIVTVMGHVDHGKTSLLDAIRSADVAAGEAGGITQHIGAYQVNTARGVITFLDTPGHEAFTAMRARGAMVTDLVILVVAADDSVMPQTIEAIDHAKAANVPIVVAINKVDLPAANVQRVKQELAQHGLMAEDWGGKNVMVEVSAKTRLNIDKLIEMILLEAELLELKANPARAARGAVLEARVDPKRGVTATVLVQAGTLKVGDVIVCGLSYGRVRAMLDEHRVQLKEALPSRPVEILGLSHVPQVGDQFTVVADERAAREIAERRSSSVKESAGPGRSTHVSLENLHDRIAEGKLLDLPVILKADVQGSLQAILDSLGKLPTKNIQLRWVHTGIGNINESDVLLAEASDALVFGFNVKIEGSAESEAKKDGVDVRLYKIIYEMLEDVKAAMEGLLKPEEVETVRGRAQVKAVFSASKFGAIAGCMVTEGKLVRAAKARVIRGGQTVVTGPVSSLRRFKDDVKEVEKGFECGIAIEGFKAYEQGDLIEVFILEKKARRLEA